VHRYNFDIPATLRLRELIAGYGRMRGLEEMTVQQRGQRLNEFVAELLRYWGLGRVEANVRSIGEIDVAFAIDDTRFILEAKWEQAPVSFDPIAKLSRRITQRLTGPRGVFLSMSGYTAGAIGDMLRGQQPDILLLDRSHLEAMLSGLFSPADLFTGLLDRASCRGEVQVPLTGLLMPDDRSPLPALTISSPAGDFPPVITETAPGIHAEVVLHGTQPQDTVIDGITVDGLGQEERHTIDFRAGIWSAVWLSGLRFFLTGDGHFGLVDLDNTTTVPIDERLRSLHPGQRGAVRIDEHTVMTATRHGTVYRIDVETGKSTLMARLDMLALGCDLASGHQGRAYVLEHRGSPRSFIPIVVALSGYMP